MGKQLVQPPRDQRDEELVRIAVRKIKSIQVGFRGRFCELCINDCQGVGDQGMNRLKTGHLCLPLTL